MLRILGRKGDKTDSAPGSRSIDGQLHVLVSRSTTITATSKGQILSPPASTVPPTFSASATTTVVGRGGSTIAPPPRSYSTEKKILSGVANPAPRIDEKMHVLTARPKALASTASLALVDASQRTEHTTAPPAQSAFRTPAGSSSPTTSSFRASSSREDVGTLMRRLRPAPIPPDSPPSIIAGCVAEVLGITDSHGLLTFLEETCKESARSRSETMAPRASMSHKRHSSFASISSQASSHDDLLPRLAIKAKGLFDDNKRLHSEIRELNTQRAELEAQLQRLQSAMENLVRVAEIMNVRPRLTPPSSPAAEDDRNVSDPTPTPKCASCGITCPTCITGAMPIMDRRTLVRSAPQWCLLPKDLPENEESEENAGKLRIPPPPRRPSRVSSLDAATFSPSRPTSIHLSEADCGVSLNRFPMGTDDDESDNDTEVLANFGSPNENVTNTDEGDLNEDGNVYKIPRREGKSSEDHKVESAIPLIKEFTPAEPDGCLPIVNILPLKDGEGPCTEVRYSRRASLMVDYECDAKSNTPATADTADGDILVLKTEFNGQQRLSMSLEPTSQSSGYKFKRVSASVVCSASSEGIASLLSSTSAVRTDLETSVDIPPSSDVPAVGVNDELYRSPLKEPDGYPWW